MPVNTGTRRDALRRLFKLTTSVAFVAFVSLAGSAVSVDTAGGGLAPSEAPEASMDAAPGQVLVRFRRGVRGSDRVAVRRAHGLQLDARLPLDGLELDAIARGRSVVRVSAALERDPRVAYAEPNYIYRLTRTPNDPLFSDLWGLHSPSSDADIDAPEAWELSTGSANVVVAVVDTGVAYEHPDLAPNIWTNPGETGAGKETNGIDDDANGLIDDVRGWDWVNGDKQPLDLDGHGTHVAGTIGAAGDNAIGVVGVNWHTSLMALQIFDGDEVTTAGIVSAFAYARDEGADIVNGSFGGPFSNALLETIKSMPDTLVVVAAGNGGIDQVGDNNDALPVYPCGFTVSNLICVAATDGSDRLASFSNYGAASVDLGAPGTGVVSTIAPSGYASLEGTSMATPHVAGAAALAWAIRPSLSTTYVKRAIMESVDPRSALATKTVTGGRLNLANVAAWASNPPPPDLTAPTNPTLSSSTHTPSAWSRNRTVMVQFTGAADPSGVDGFSYAWTESATTTPDTVKEAEQSVTGAFSPSLEDGASWHFHLRTRDNAGNWSAPVHLGPFFIDSTAPTQPIVARLPQFQLARTFDVDWSASDAAAGVATYDVSYEKSSYTAYSGTTVAWKTETGATNDSLTASPGFTYCFQSRARDAAGNLSAWSERACTAVPADNPAFRHGSGWSKKTEAGYFLGTYSLAKRRNATLTRGGAQGKEFALVATRCPGCGSVRVYWDVGLSRRVDLASSTVRKRQIIPIVAFDYVRTVEIKVVVASSGRPVRIDGLGVSRS